MAETNAETDDVTLGKKLVADGKLQELREQLGLSATSQAYMVGIQPIMIYSWESGQSSPSPRSARLVVKWYREVLDKLAERDVDCQNLLHISQASQLLGASYGTVKDWWHKGMIDCVDLGVLGFYVQRSQVEELVNGGSR